LPRCYTFLHNFFDFSFDAKQPTKRRPSREIKIKKEHARVPRSSLLLWLGMAGGQTHYFFFLGKSVVRASGFPLQ
jgi:hypothetical protein